MSLRRLNWGNFAYCMLVISATFMFTLSGLRGGTFGGMNMSHAQQCSMSSGTSSVGDVQLLSLGGGLVPAIGPSAGMDARYKLKHFLIDEYVMRQDNEFDGKYSNGSAPPVGIIGIALVDLYDSIFLFSNGVSHGKDGEVPGSDEDRLFPSPSSCIVHLCEATSCILPVLSWLRTQPPVHRGVGGCRTNDPHISPRPESSGPAEITSVVVGTAADVSVATCHLRKKKGMRVSTHVVREPGYGGRAEGDAVKDPVRGGRDELWGRSCSTGGDPRAYDVVDIDVGYELEESLPLLQRLLHVTPRARSPRNILFSFPAAPTSKLLHFVREVLRWESRYSLVLLGGDCARRVHQITRQNTSNEAELVFEALQHQATDCVNVSYPHRCAMRLPPCRILLTRSRQTLSGIARLTHGKEDVTGSNATRSRRRNLPAALEHFLYFGSSCLTDEKGRSAPFQPKTRVIDTQQGFTSGVTIAWLFPVAITGLLLWGMLKNCRRSMYD